MRLSRSSPNDCSRTTPWKDRTSIPIPDLCALVELCLKSTYFQFCESFYEQVEGAAMGSPLSPIVANIFMEDFEIRALDTSSKKPKMWHRFVDDVFVIWLHGDQLLEEFHQHLNRQNPSILFTVEKESGQNCLFRRTTEESRNKEPYLSFPKMNTQTNISTLIPTTKPRPKEASSNV